MSQVAGPGKSVSMQSIVRDLIADTESVVVMDLMAETLESVVVRDLMAETLPSWLLDPLLSSIFSCLCDIPGCLSKSHVHTS